MNNALEAIEVGSMVLDYIGKGAAFLYFCSMALNVVLAKNLIDARHALAVKTNPAIVCQR